MSQEFYEGPKIRQDPGGQVAIAYDFERESGVYEWEEIIFIGVVGFRFTASRYCSDEQVGSYDRLDKVSNASWVAGVQNAPGPLHHFRIYFDDIGCYEVLATDFVPPPRV